MKFGFTLSLLLLWLSAAHAQGGFWREVPEQNIVVPAGVEVNFSLVDYRTVELETPALRRHLREAPVEGEGAGRAPLYWELPTPDGGALRVRLEESSVLHPDLAARYPELKSYRAFGDGVSGRIAVSPLGVHAAFDTPNGKFYVNPYSAGQDRYHIVYYKRDVELSDEFRRLSCGVDEWSGEDIQRERPTGNRHAQGAGRGPEGGAALDLRLYDMALAATGEYSELKGGTKELVMATFNATMTLLNQILEQEVAIRMQLIANNDRLIFLDPDTDPYTTANNAGTVLSQNTTAIVQISAIPLNSFDIGHVFTGPCTSGIAGLASLGSVCGNNKSNGVTCHYQADLESIVVDVMAHEVGHQFTANHTFNNCPSSGTGPSGYEPGSGSTIMSYSGSCGNQNISSIGAYYHVASLNEMIGFSRNGNGNTCATRLPTGNSEPMVVLPYENGFFIPVSTPFELHGSATDVDGDSLTYSWEQFDLGPASTLGEPEGNAPLFRSMVPDTLNWRSFPRRQVIVDNANSREEVLPTYSRNLNFRLTVRDNHPGAGAAVWKQVAFKSTESAGPFLVEYPNLGDEVWRVGEYQEVTWDVANTDRAPVNCRSVNIRLSTDGGYTWPVMLAQGTPNTGSAFVTVPNITGADMRIRVEAADNIFFDISNANFAIAPSLVPSFTLEGTPLLQNLCLPATAVVAFNSTSILDYEGEIALDIVSDLPAGAVATFSPDTISVGESTVLTLDLSNVRYSGRLSVIVRAIVPGRDTALRTFSLDLVDNDFSELALLTPVNGQAGINLEVPFNWTALENAVTYDFQLATSPTFAGDDLVQTVTGLTDPTVTPSEFFDKNELYYWRVRAVNSCGPGPWSIPAAFHTVNAICSVQNSTDTPVNLPGTGPAVTRTSSLFVTQEGTISDINLPEVRINYQVVAKLRVTLISPSGKRVVLYDQSCPNFTGSLRIGFDDDAPADIACPPDDQRVFKPVEALSAFAGEPALGTWVLEVRISETGGSAGNIERWNLEFCAEGAATNPALVVNDTLDVPPGQRNPITQTLLRTEDAAVTPDDLTYTIVTLPAHGELLLANELVAAGDTFTQADINNLRVQYLHTGQEPELDAFTFVVENGLGGFIPVDTFNIDIFDGAIVGVDDPEAPAGFRLSPNPTSGQVMLEFDTETRAAQPLRVFDLTGRLVQQVQLAKGTSRHTLDLTALAPGVYVLQVERQAVRVVRQ